jgi:peptide/nickel transport system permease protein
LLIGLLAFLIWGIFARQVRGEVLGLKQRDYVKLAQVAGASPIRVLLKHILPGVSSTILVVATMQVGSVILVTASLSFLGAGVPPPTPAWGAMVAEGRLYLNTAWWVALIPGLAIGITVMAFTLLGDWLRDHLDPTLRQLV